MSEEASARAQRAAPLQEQLERYYQRNHSQDIQITDFTAISDGWETEVYSFTATLHHQVERLILRVYPGAPEAAAEKMLREYNGMFGLQAFSRYPVPVVMDHVQDAVWLGKPFLIMQKIDGRPLGVIMREQRERWPELSTRFMQLFVDLHRIDYQPFLDMESPEMQADPSAFLRLKLAYARALILDQFQQTWAVPVLDWLEAHQRDISPQIAVMHGDFHPYNILVTADEQAYVIDWSGVEVGDYRYDLGWTLLLPGTMGGGSAERDHLLHQYERLCGHPVEQIGYFEVIACARRLLGLTVSLGGGAESLGMRVEATAIMRTQGEHFRQVYAVLRKITGLTLPEIERLLGSLES